MAAIFLLLFSLSSALSLEGSFRRATITYNWGEGRYGALGHVRYGDEEFPRQMMDFSKADMRTIVCGPTATGGVDETGLAFTWGKDGSRDFYISVPQTLETFKGLHVNEIALGDFHGIALLKSGDLYTWGHGDVGQLGISTAQNFTSKPLQLNLDDRIDPIAWGTSHVQSKNKDFRVVCAAANYSLAMTARGNVYSWGNGPSGQLGLGKSHTQGNTPEQIFFPKPICSIACARDHAMATTTDGNLYVWGENSRGQLGLGDTAPRYVPELVSREKPLRNQVCDVAAGPESSGLITAERHLYVWGLDQTTPALRTFTPMEQDRLAQLAFGEHHMIALTENNHVYTWGSNEHDQLGVGTYEEDGTPIEYIAEPMLVKGLEGKLIKQICAGNSHSVALAAAPKIAYCPCMQDGWRKNAESGWEAKVLEVVPPDMTEVQYKEFKHEMERLNSYMDGYAAHVNSQQRESCLNPCAGLICPEGHLPKVKPPCTCQCVQAVETTRRVPTAEDAQTLKEIMFDLEHGKVPQNKTVQYIEKRIAEPTLKDGSSYMPPSVALDNSVEMSGENAGGGEPEGQADNSGVELDSARDGVDMGRGWGVPGGLKQKADTSSPPPGSMRKSPRGMDWWPAEAPTKVADATEVVLDPEPEGDGMDPASTRLTAAAMVSQLNLGSKPWDGADFKPWEAPVLRLKNQTLPASAWAMRGDMPEPPTPAQLKNGTKLSLLPGYHAAPKVELMPEVPLTKGMSQGNSTVAPLKKFGFQPEPTPGHPYLHEPDTPFSVDREFLKEGMFTSGNVVKAGKSGTFLDRFSSRSGDELPAPFSTPNPPLKLKLGCHSNPGGIACQQVAEQALNNLIVIGSEQMTGVAQSTKAHLDKKWLLEEAMERGIDISAATHPAPVKVALLPTANLKTMPHLKPQPYKVVGNVDW